MIVVTTEHADHDPDRLGPSADGRPYWERPIRIDTLLSAVRDLGHPAATAPDRGLEPIRRVHDAGYIDFLATAFDRYRSTPGAGPA